MNCRRIFLVTAAGGALGALAPGWASANDYPRRPVKIVSGFAAGGSSDPTLRAFARELEQQLGQPVVVEYRAGATGIVALEAFAQSPSDGYTLMMLSNVTLSALHMARKPFDMERRFMPLGMFSATRVVLVVNPRVMDVRDLHHLIDHVRRHPGTPYASAGHGGLGHLGMEMWAAQEKMKLLHVAYRGTAPGLEDVLGGRVPMMLLDANAALPHVRSGALRAIATVSTQRSPALPDLPTALELGVGSLQIDGIIGLVAPPGTPVPIVDRLRTAIRQATESETYVASVRNAGAVRQYMDAPEFGPWLQKESDRWGRVVRDTGLDQPQRN